MFCKCGSPFALAAEPPDLVWVEPIVVGVVGGVGAGVGAGVGGVGAGVGAGVGDTVATHSKLVGSLLFDESQNSMSSRYTLLQPPPYCASTNVRYTLSPP